MNEYKLKNTEMLKYYADRYKIDELTSEDIVKLMMKPYLKIDIATAFGITEEEFNEIKEKKGIKNIILESMIRDIKSILYYFDMKRRYFSNQIRKQIVDKLAQDLSVGVPKRDFYIEKLSKTDFCRKKLNPILMKEQ